MLAVEAHILEAVKQQIEEEDELRKQSQAGPLLRRIEGTLRRHESTLKAKLDQYDGEAQGGLKQLVTELFGNVAGLYDKLREHPLSRMLRDDYTSLSLVATSYTMMHAYGLAVHDHDIANLAIDHLNDVTPLIMELAELIPRVVVIEVAEQNDFPVDLTVGDAAVANTQATWSVNA